MERFMTGDIVVISFHFTDSDASRKRPALVLSDLKGDDFIICQITSKQRNDPYSVILENKDLEKQKLKTRSVIRPNRF